MLDYTWILNITHVISTYLHFRHSVSFAADVHFSLSFTFPAISATNYLLNNAFTSYSYFTLDLLTFPLPPDLFKKNVIDCYVDPL
jgi:hypothetical protein